MAQLKHQIAIKSTPAIVYAAIARQDGVRHWWTADAKVEHRVGGKAEFGFDKRATVFRMKIEELSPENEVIWSCHGDNQEWADTTLTWKISAENGLSILRFTHSGWKSASELYAICNSSWGELMHRLRDYAEGKNPGPHWRE